MSPRGGKRKGSGRKPAYRTAAFTVRVHPVGLGEAKKFAKEIGLAFNDYVYSALCAKNSEVRELSAEEKARLRKIRELERKMFALIEKGQEDAAQKYDDEIAKLEGEDEDEDEEISTPWIPDERVQAAMDSRAPITTERYDKPKKSK